MKKLLLLGALLAGGSLCLNDVSVGHGGNYRGPGDTVPPGGGGGGGGGGGPSSPGPSGPSAPGPAGPSSPGPSAPAGPAGSPGGAAGPVTLGGGGDSIDLTVWDFWWGFNKDPYLNLKAAIHDGGTLTGSDNFFIGRGEKEQSKDSLRPSEQAIRQKVVPALINALETETQNDIVTGALIALAKIGDAKNEEGESRFEGIIAKFLGDSNQEIAETAALALGILANQKSIDTLIDLLKDSKAGQDLVGSSEVPYRTRAFAAYGLGLIGYATEDQDDRKKIVATLVEMLEAPQMSTRDVKVAALIAMGLVPLEPGASPAQDAEIDWATFDWKDSGTRQAQVAYVRKFFADDGPKGNHYLVRAHAPTTLARLVQGAPETVRVEVVKDLLAGLDKHSKAEREIIQSCTLALGQLGDMDADDVDKEVRSELERMTADGDEQAKRFAFISLAQIGGRPGDGEGDPMAGQADLSKFMLKQLTRGKSLLRPWVGLSIGVWQRELIDNDLVTLASAQQALRASLADEKTPAQVGAYAIGVGISRDVEAKSIVLEKLDSFRTDEARGYLAVALGLMNERDTIETIQNIVRESKYRPDLLKQAAIALGLLGDKDLVPDLVTMLEEAKGLAAQASISSALGFIGDSRSIDPLVAMLGNDQITGSARGFAAVALGIVADKEPLPWNSKISTNINYRANTTTLTGEGGTGILDIL